MKDIKQRIIQCSGNERNLVLGLMLFGLICWLYNLNSPLLDFHSWRQTDTAAIARNFYHNGFNLLYPQIDWGGSGPGYVESEFQLVPFLISILYLIFGVHEFIARLVVIAFSVGSVYILYQLARLYFDKRTSAFSALFFIISPLELFFGRAVMPESAMIFFSIGSLYFFDKWTRNEERKYFAIALLCTALAFMVKIPTLYLGLPLLWLAYAKYGKSMFSEPKLYLFALLALIPAYLWYYHANTVLVQYNSFNIWNIGTDKWSNLQILLGGDYYLILFNRLATYVFTPVGLLLFIYGLYIKPSREEYLFYFWTIAIFAYFLMLANGNIYQQYYQLPLVPVGSVFVGKALSKIYELKSWAGLGLIFILIVSSIYIVMPLYTVNTTIWDAGHVVDKIADENALIVASTSHKGNPNLLYFAHRKGWLLDYTKWSPEIVDSLKIEGAKYLVIVPDQLLLYYPSFSRYLFQNYSSIIGSDFVIFDLSKPSNIYSAPKQTEMTFKGSGALLGISVEDGGDDDLLNIASFYNSTSVNNKHFMILFSFKDRYGRTIQENNFLTSELVPENLTRNNYVAVFHGTAKQEISNIGMGITELNI